MRSGTDLHAAQMVTVQMDDAREREMRRRVRPPRKSRSDLLTCSLGAALLAGASLFIWPHADSGREVRADASSVTGLQADGQLSNHGPWSHASEAGATLAAGARRAAESTGSLKPTADNGALEVQRSTDTASINQPSPSIHVPAVTLDHADFTPMPLSVPESSPTSADTIGVVQVPPVEVNLADFSAGQRDAPTGPEQTGTTVAEPVLAKPRTGSPGSEPTTGADQRTFQQSKTGDGPTPAEVSRLMTLAQERLKYRDIVAMRALLQRASKGGHPKALLALAETYDPAMLERWGAVGMRADPELARSLYERAAAQDVIQARERLLAMH